MLKWIRKAVRRILGSTTSSPAQWFVDWIRGSSESDSGVQVDGKTCLRYAPVWNAVNRICGRLAQLPMVVYERTGDRTKERATKHPAYRLLRQRPNTLMSPSVFKTLIQYHALIWGNGRAWIERNRRGDPIGLIPLLPGRTDTVLVNDEKWHITKVEVEPGEWKTYKFHDRDVIHIQGLGYDGLVGYPLWELAQNSWGLGLAAEKTQANLYKQYGIPGLILQAPPGVFEDDEEAKKFLGAFRDMHEGADNAGKTALLRGGITAEKLANTPEETQSIEHRKFQRQDAALWFLLESILGDDSSVSYKSLEQKQLAELINCLNPWLVKWQEECEAKLLRERERVADSHYVRFKTGALLRSDTKTTYETLAGGVRGMLITINEAREVLDLPPVPGGDELQNPAITTGSPGDKTDEDDADEAETDDEETDEQPKNFPWRSALVDSRQRIRDLIASRLADLAAIERQRIESAAAKSGDVQAWADRFYERWQQNLARSIRPAVESDDDAASLASDWCAESRRQLADLGPEATADGLTERVQELAATIA